MFIKYLTAALVAGATTAHAHDIRSSGSLGFHTLELGYGLAQSENETIRDTFAKLDVRITAHHGLQGDLRLRQYDDVSVGQLGAHLYMAPRSDQKYGLYLTYHDENQEQNSEISLAVEGIFDFGNAITTEVKAGMGRDSTMGLDYIFGDLAVDYAVTDHMAAFARITVTDIQERDFDALASDITIGAQFDIPQSALSVSVGATRSDLTGETEAEARNFAFVQATYTFGGTHDATAPASEQLFRSVSPLNGVWQRGLIVYED